MRDSLLPARSTGRPPETLAAQGLRVLAFAQKRLSTPQARLTHDDVRDGLKLIGLQGMMDPPRAGAVTAVRRCRRAGIRVKMITGDHVLTAQAVARQIGLNGDHDGAELVAVTGRELDGCLNWAGAAGMIGLQFAITYVPLLNRLLHTAPIPADSWVWIVGVAFAAYAVVGFEKWIRFRTVTASEGTAPSQP